MKNAKLILVIVLAVDGVLAFGCLFWMVMATNPMAWTPATRPMAVEVHVTDMQSGSVTFVQGVIPTRAFTVASTGYAHGVDAVVFDNGAGIICILVEGAEIKMGTDVQSPVAANCFTAALQNPTVQDFIRRWEATGKKVDPVWANH